MDITNIAGEESKEDDEYIPEENLEGVNETS